ncbi:putative septum formation protein [Actinoplanes missouriensis 431]|uniref:Nucleoside triphosphate pyrophosphatase n=1 Tax=Actinoplanes missouriensis (strain ATCC 14538 / DSM 43046 / CBS 188.64 / JCM 3121 / NBRC 102363 / NCIMB 12654 / NRRL B-3342 / UNCC 431) TaxID=512565 RepID=I0HI34_ACTM4|nr:putative septum formation protein [Actinoplanes missouriensis 431]
MPLAPTGPLPRLVVSFPVQNDITYRLILASASPARRALLTGAGIDAEVIVSGVDESVVEAEDAHTLCLALARMKARTVAADLPADPGALVLGCDSVLAFEGEIFGKPASPEEAVKRWSAMRGKSGVLHTGHHLTGLVSGLQAESVGTTVVHFADVSDAEIEAYVASGEPLQVAGAFTLDGRGGAFVERIEGDPGNVIGLSLPLLRTLLAEMGVPITSLWRK